MEAWGGGGDEMVHLYNYTTFLYVIQVLHLSRNFFIFRTLCLSSNGERTLMVSNLS